MFKILTFILGLSKPLPVQVGIASHYSVRDNHGTRTSSGIPLNDSKLTAASRTIKNGTKVRVTNLKSGKAIVVTITDHFPGTKGRILDCSVAVAKELGFYKSGLARVKVEKLP